MQIPFPKFEAEPLDAASLKIHDRAVACARRFLEAEAALLNAIIEVDRTKLYAKFGYNWITPYCVKELGLSEEIAACFIRVARKSEEVPELKQAVETGKITIFKAKKIATVINDANKDEWIGKAATLAKDKLESAVAEANPLAPEKETARETGRGTIRIKVEVPKELLERAREIVSTKRGRQVNWGETLEFVLEEFLERHDPVRRAKRSEKDANRSRDRQATKTIPSHIRHAVHRRDHGRCQALLPDGSKCGEGRWIHLHHIVPRGQGGGDEVENLVTLCSSHHRQWHNRPH